MGKPKGESRGLAYLSKARPAAIQHLLKFFGESARHLDRKTRFLISVVTKVINFSPRGLEQYVRRALEEGASPDEIVDAVLCAYPCAGLTKVVDAIDVILDMGLPGFEELGSSEAVSAETALAGGSPAGRHEARVSKWLAVAAPEEIARGESLHVRIGSLELALFNVDGQILAIDHHCPHSHGPLAGGVVNGEVVTCPLHGWKFHLAGGECLNRPGARVRTYQVRTGEGGKVEVLLPALDTPPEPN